MKRTIRGVLLVLLAVFCTGPVGSAQIVLTGLPAPSHGNLDYIGYYFANSKEGDYTETVNPYTNLFIASPKNAAYSEDPDWQTPLYAQLADAVADGKHIMLGMDQGTSNQQEFSWDAILDIADEFWSSVVMVQIFHEVEMSKEALEGNIATLRGKFSTRTLPDRPIMAAYANLSNSDAWEAEGLDIVNLHAYTTSRYSDSYGSIGAAIDDIEDVLSDFLALVDTLEKKAFITMQSYDRGGDFDNIEMLVALQEVYYLAAAADENVIGLGMFNFGQGGGVKDHPELIYHHQRIAWAAGLSGLEPGCTPGRGNCLIPEQWRGADGYIQSESGQYRMYYQSDGNIVVYDLWNSWGVIWASYAFHTPGYLQMQGDGNLVAYDSGSQAPFHTSTNGNNGAYLYLDDTGHLSVVAPNLAVLWIRGPTHNY